MSAWREEVRRAAKESAQSEARAAWNAEADESVPFDYRWEHIQAVAGLALHLAPAVGADVEIAEASAWLHDICKTQLDHAKVGAQEAASLLQKTDFPQGKIPAVVHAIERHAGLRRQQEVPLEPPETALLWDADKLSKLGVQALMYNMAAPYANGASLPERRREMVDFCRDELAQTVACMNTEPARRLAQRRYQAMLKVLAMWETEESEQGMARGEGSERKR